MSTFNKFNNLNLIAFVLLLFSWTASTAAAAAAALVDQSEIPLVPVEISMPDTPGSGCPSPSTLQTFCIRARCVEKRTCGRAGFALDLLDRRCCRPRQSLVSWTSITGTSLEINSNSLREVEEMRIH
ncbi:hypothetical protein FB45DRAFT_162101 [Roridomyces roridus]|uniref:Uncharacterized protein n=1 Tax=Roridomyces roridus TaxID=1738132 RepID=A0AAD7BFG5_9AGAR|nr:hypothetical protein FB45DRAFT_162101 [Roridomyces roridus]